MDPRAPDRRHQSSRRRRRLILGALSASLALGALGVLMSDHSGPAAAWQGSVPVDQDVSAEPARVEPAPAEQAPASRARAPRALFFGDSYFVGHFDFPATKTMAGVAGRRLGWRYVIRGAGGTGFVAANDEYGIPAYLGQIEQGAFDVGARRWVVIEGGSNDVYRDPTEVRRNAKKVLRIAATRFSGAEIVMIGPMSYDEDYTADRPIHRAVRAAARARGVPFIAPLKWLKGRLEYVSSDGVHPTEEGYRYLGRRLARALRKL